MVETMHEVWVGWEKYFMIPEDQLKKKAIEQNRSTSRKHPKTTIDVEVPHQPPTKHQQSTECQAFSESSQSSSA